MCGEEGQKVPGERGVRAPGFALVRQGRSTIALDSSHRRILLSMREGMTETGLSPSRLRRWLPRSLNASRFR